MTLNDPNKPVPGTPTGPLTQSGVWVKGTLSLTASATDAGGGLAALRLLVDGNPQAGAGRQTFACDFTFAVPCPASGSGSLSLNTTTLVDGTHTVLVQAEDAGGVTANKENTASWPLLVDNHAPGSPTSLVLTDTPVAGSPVGFSWVNPDQGVASPVETVKWQLLLRTVNRGRLW